MKLNNYGLFRRDCRFVFVSETGKKKTSVPEIIYYEVTTDNVKYLRAIKVNERPHKTTPQTVFNIMFVFPEKTQVNDLTDPTQDTFIKECGSVQKEGSIYNIELLRDADNLVDEIKLTRRLKT